MEFGYYVLVTSLNQMKKYLGCVKKLLKITEVNSSCISRDKYHRTNVVYLGLSLGEARKVDSVVNSRLMFSLAIAIAPIDSVLIRLKVGLSKLKKLIFRNN